MTGPCLCGDMHCPSCGPAQGNWRCPICKVWQDDGCEHFDAEGNVMPEHAVTLEAIQKGGMTEKQQLNAMLTRAGVVFEEDAALIKVKSTNSDDGPNVGYGQFYTEWTFDGDGNLTQVGVWE